jgi:hypothetical protein
LVFAVAAYEPAVGGAISFPDLKDGACRAPGSKTPTALSARYDGRTASVVIGLSSGVEIAFKPHQAQGLEAAKPEDLAEIDISPSGLGLHFPMLDADLYLPALLEGFLGSRR